MGFLNEQELEGVVWINGKRNGGVVKTFDKESKKLIIAVLSLTNAKETLAYLYQTVDQAILSLTNIQKQWNTMGANYTDLLDNIDSMQDHKFSLIPDDLKAAKESWNDIHKDAEFISKDIAFKQE